MHSDRRLTVDFLLNPSSGASSCLGSFAPVKDLPLPSISLAIRQEEAAAGQPSPPSTSYCARPYSVQDPFDKLSRHQNDVPDVYGPAEEDPCSDDAGKVPATENEEDDTSGGGKPNRRANRKLMSDLQRALLEEQFLIDPFPTTLRKAQLGIQLGMSLKTVHVWFQNKRARTKKKGTKLRRVTASKKPLKLNNNKATSSSSRHSGSSSASSSPSVSPAPTSPTLNDLSVQAQLLQPSPHPYNQQHQQLPFAYTGYPTLPTPHGHHQMGGRTPLENRTREQFSLHTTAQQRRGSPQDLSYNVGVTAPQTSSSATLNPIHALLSLAGY